MLSGPGSAPLRPPLKWAGGKRWLLPYLKELYEPFRDRRLVEPLCGGLAVITGLLPERALANDVNEHAINFYLWLRRGLRATIPMENDADLYYAHRSRFNSLLIAGKSSTRESAELFYYLNRTGYNGLCRFNRRGEFNVPFGRHKSIIYTRDFLAYRDIFRQWSFSSADFAAAPLEEDDFVYADPPYDVEFRQYAQTGFSWQDQIRLGEWLAEHRGPVVLSNQATPRIVDLYRALGFDLQFLSAPRMISCTGDRTRAEEVLATKGL